MKALNLIAKNMPYCLQELREVEPFLGKRLINIDFSDGELHLSAVSVASSEHSPVHLCTANDSASKQERGAVDAPLSPEQATEDFCVNAEESKVKPFADAVACATGLHRYTGRE